MTNAQCFDTPMMTTSFYIPVKDMDYLRELVKQRIIPSMAYGYRQALDLYIKAIKEDLK